MRENWEDDFRDAVRAGFIYGVPVGFLLAALIFKII